MVTLENWWLTFCYDYWQFYVLAGLGIIYLEWRFRRLMKKIKALKKGLVT